MKKIIFIWLLLVCFISAKSNDLPFSWTHQVEYLGDNNVKVILHCDVDSGWHIYSMNNPDGGSLKTTIKVVDNSILQSVPKVSEPTPIKEYEEVFKVDQWYHDGDVDFIVELQVKKGTKDFDVEIENMACIDGKCTPPIKSNIKVVLDSDELNESESILWVFIFGFGAGFLALLTPCVFPMIPMTVTFFTKQKGKKGIQNAFIYGVSIIIIYVLLGLGITLVFGEEALYLMASSPVFNILFFCVFLVFAFSFLGAFEITMPQAFVNKMDEKSDKGGLIGIFFMAFTLTLVSFSCTGPLIGTLLVEAAIGGGITGPLLGMLGFGVALAIPFTLFAIFPSWLNKLPKSGGWLNSVKVVLGFLELALALKFLSNADLVLQTRWLTREIFIAIWIVIFILMGLYLLGKIKFAHDSELKFLTVPRTLLAIITLTFVVYLIPGMFGAPLKMLSGVLPPDHYSEGWNLNQSVNLANNLNHNASSIQSENCPNGLNCYHDYDEALIVAKKENKPLLVDFTGYTCVNCRLMEQNVWSDKSIDSLIRNEYVLVSLYVDDRNELPNDKVYISSRNGEQIITYGGKWRDMEIERYQELTQPLYVLLDHKEELLMPKRSYDLNIKSYKQFLIDGLNEFKKRAL